MIGLRMSYGEDGDGGERDVVAVVFAMRGVCRLGDKIEWWIL